VGAELKLFWRAVFACAQIPVFKRLVETGAVALLDTIYYECHYWEVRTSRPWSHGT
jgi:hypothetical protein